MFVYFHFHFHYYSLSHLQRNNFDLFEAILKDAWAELPKWNNALLAVQTTITDQNDVHLQKGHCIKVKCHVRFIDLPHDPNNQLPFPNNDQIGLFREVRGIVVRMSLVRLLEMKREFQCPKCRITVCRTADYSCAYKFDVPKCSTTGCRKKWMQPKNNEPLPDQCINFQELKIQVSLFVLNVFFLFDE